MLILNIVRRELYVPYYAKDVFALVADIERYPEFLPWCSAAKILQAVDNVVEASLTISKSGLAKNFTTRNLMTPMTRIEMHLLKGPFKHLYGLWQFQEDENGCHISLELQFSFDSKVLSLMLESIFQPIANNLLDAFVKRAESLCPRKK